MKSEHTLSVLVANHPGALTKIAGMFYRRAYNIETITVYKTHIENLTKIIINGQASDRDAEILRRQIENMVDVYEAQLLDRSQSLVTEMCLVRLGFEDMSEREAIMTTAAPYAPKIRGIEKDGIILEVVAEPSIVDDFVKIMAGLNLLDVSRTGMTVIGPTLKKAGNDKSVEINGRL